MKKKSLWEREILSWNRSHSLIKDWIYQQWKKAAEIARSVIPISVAWKNNNLKKLTWHLKEYNFSTSIANLPAFLSNRSYKLASNWKCWCTEIDYKITLIVKWPASAWEMKSTQRDHPQTRAVSLTTGGGGFCRSAEPYDFVNEPKVCGWVGEGGRF